jgi:hypothetical protein
MRFIWINVLAFHALTAVGCASPCAQDNRSFWIYDFRGSASNLRGGVDQVDRHDENAFLVNQWKILRHDDRSLAISFNDAGVNTSLLLLFRLASPNGHSSVSTRNGSLRAWLVRVRPDSILSATNPLAVPAEYELMAAAVSENAAAPDPSLFIPLEGVASIHLTPQNIERIKVDLHSDKPIPVYSAWVRRALQGSLDFPDMQDVFSQWHQALQRPPTAFANVVGEFSLTCYRISKYHML